MKNYWAMGEQVQEKAMGHFFCAQDLTCDLRTGHDSGFLGSVKPCFHNRASALRDYIFCMPLSTKMQQSLLCAPTCYGILCGLLLSCPLRCFKGFGLRDSVPAPLPWLFLVLPHVEGFAASSCSKQKSKDLPAHLGRRRISTFLPI